MDTITVGDCLIQAGIDINDYYGKIGLAYFITVNGEKITLPGTRGEAPIITLNGHEASVDDHVEPHDRIQIVKGIDGVSPTVTIADVIGEIKPVRYYVNDEAIAVKPIYIANGNEVNETYEIRDNDTITVKVIETVGELLTSLDIHAKQQPTYRIFVNERPLTFDNARMRLLINGENGSYGTPIKENDRIQLVPAETITLQDVITKLEMELYYSIRVTFNGEPVELKQQIVECKRGDTILHEDDVIYADDELTMRTLKQRPFIFQDVFRYVDMDLTEIGGNYQLRHNETEASFHDPIQEGDQLAIETIK